MTWKININTEKERAKGKEAGNDETTKKNDGKESTAAKNRASCKLEEQTVENRLNAHGRKRDGAKTVSGRKRKIFLLAFRTAAATQNVHSQTQSHRYEEFRPQRETERPPIAVSRRGRASKLLVGKIGFPKSSSSSKRFRGNKG